MKSNNVYGALLILALAMIVSTAPMAQAQAQPRAKASIPFEFNLNDSSMPAGMYEVSSLNDKVLAVRNMETKDARLVLASLSVQASQAQGTPSPKLVFHKCGDQYFLAQIWYGQSNIGIAFPESKHEKELQLAGNTGQPEVVVIAMK